MSEPGITAAVLWNHPRRWVRGALGRPPTWGRPCGAPCGFTRVGDLDSLRHVKPAPLRRRRKDPTTPQSWAALWDLTHRDSDSHNQFAQSISHSIHVDVIVDLHFVSLAPFEESRTVGNGVVLELPLISLECQEAAPRGLASQVADILFDQPNSMERSEPTDGADRAPPGGCLVP